MQLVQHRTAHTLSAQSLHTRLTGRQASSSVLQREHAESIYLPSIENSNHQLVFRSNLVMIQALNKQIKTIEKRVLSQVKGVAEFIGIKTVPGIGDILGLTIVLETGDIYRFPNVGHYASYCRTLKSTRTSNGKKKGEGN